MTTANTSARPFFIVGCPRTGTTLLRRILSSHSLVAIPPESLFVYEYLVAEHVPFDRRKAMLCNDPAFESWNIRLTFEDLADCKTMADCIITAHKKYAASHGKPFWGHKTPTIIRHTEIIAERQPQVIFVHMVRDSRAVANSLKCSKAHRLNVLMGAQRYNLDTNLGLALEARHPDRTRRVYYEELCRNPESTVRGLCDWIGVSFESGMLANTGAQFLPLDAYELQHGHHSNVGKPIMPNFSDKWKHELSQVEIELVNTLTADTMAKAGYKIVAYQSVPPKCIVIFLRAQHCITAFYLLTKSLWARPYLLRIVRRKWRLGTLFPMFRDLFQGR